MQSGVASPEHMLKRNFYFIYTRRSLMPCQGYINISLKSGTNIGELDFQVVSHQTFVLMKTS